MQVKRRIRNYSITLLLIVVALLGIQVNWFVDKVVQEENEANSRINTAVCSAFGAIADADKSGGAATQCANLGAGQFRIQTETALSSLDSLVRKELNRVDEIDVPFKITATSQGARGSVDLMAHVDLVLPTRGKFFADQINEGVVLYFIFIGLIGVVFFNVFKSISDVRARENDNFDRSTIYKIGRYTFDFRNQVLCIDQRVTRITKKESQVLRFLCIDKNQIVRRDVILKELWGENDYFKGRSLDVFVARLRKHLSDDRQIRIETIYGVGFVLTDQ